MESPRRFEPEELDFTDCPRVWMSRSEMNGEMRGAIAAALPAGATFCFNYDGDKAWFQVSRPGDTNTVHLQAQRSLGR
jgi:hypothetical protein